MASQELLLIRREKWKDNPCSLGDPPSLPNMPSVSEEFLEGGFATAAVIAPVTSDVTMEVESHAPPPEHSEEERSCCCSGSVGIICLYVGGDVLLPSGVVLIGYRYDGAGGTEGVLPPAMSLSRASWFLLGYVMMVQGDLKEFYLR